MDYATQSHLTTLRDLLNYRLRELQAEVHAAELAHRHDGGAADGDVRDRKDDAAQFQLQEVDTAQERRDLGEIAEVQAALRRLDEGRYGDCADCGEPIALSRLMALPAALRCAACQTKHEAAPA